jgi:hypothetical protein
MSEQPYFVIYGCWNQPCRDTTEVEDYLHVIAKVIKTKEEQNGLQFVAIAGDNYYPQKIKEGKEKKEKKKTLNGGAKVNHVLVPVLEKGVNALKQYTDNDIPVYINYGNHDMVPNSDLTIRKESCVNELKVDDTTDDPDIDKPDCYIKATQNDLITKINSENNTNIHIDFYHTLPTNEFNNTLAFMIDTTLFYNGEYDKKCYEPSTAENVKEIQVRKIQSRIRSSSDKKNIIIIGHHPLISKKHKEKKEKGNNTKSYKNEKDDGIHKATPAFIDFFKSLQKSLEDKNIYYLCADTHLYQEGTVTLKFGDDSSMIIQQYIAGTGGTKLDEAQKKRSINEAPTVGVDTLCLPITDKKNNIVVVVNYKINETIANYGFLKVTEINKESTGINKESTGINNESTEINNESTEINNESNGVLSFKFIKVDANTSPLLPLPLPPPLLSSSSSPPPPLSFSPLLFPSGGTRKRRVKKRRTRKKKSRTKSKKREKKLI